MGSPEWRAKIDDLYRSFASGEAGDKRWARPDAPILHSLPDEKAEPHVFFHNSNYRISRKYINTEKVKVRRGSKAMIQRPRALSRPLIMPHANVRRF